MYWNISENEKSSCMNMMIGYDGVYTLEYVNKRGNARIR